MLKSEAVLSREHGFWLSTLLYQVISGTSKMLASLRGKCGQCCRWAGG